MSNAHNLLILKICSEFSSSLPFSFIPIIVYTVEVQGIAANVHRIYFEKWFIYQAYCHLFEMTIRLKLTNLGDQILCYSL